MSDDAGIEAEFFYGMQSDEAPEDEPEPIEIAEGQLDLLEPEQEQLLLDVDAKPQPLYGENLFGEPIEPPSRGAISDRFVVAPFTVLNTREGFWQERKRAWQSLGIKSELGREGDLTYSGKLAEFDHYRVKEGTKSATDTQGTSIFDPVLCEMVYRWFCPAGGLIVDPFAGGSVRGIVAAHLGYEYWGCDLSEAQVLANRTQAATIVPGNMPWWEVGDSREELEMAPRADFIFSCPPYGDLERYSDDPRDLSTLGYSEFRDAYDEIIGKALDRLSNDRFACFVVGDFRDRKTGHYNGLVVDTIRAFQRHGAGLYNEAILVNNVGSLSVRITRQFDSGRKMGKCHQNVLVFVKGDGKAAAQACMREEEG